MTTEEQIEAIRQRARKNFSLGYNCAECVVEAVLGLVETGLPPEVKKVATGFGGGVGLFGDTCGAVTGAVIAVGAVHGRSSPAGGGAEGGPPEGRRSALREARPVPALQPDPEPHQGPVRRHPLPRADREVAGELALSGARPPLPGDHHRGSGHRRGADPRGPGRAGLPALREQRGAPHRPGTGPVGPEDLRDRGRSGLLR